MDVPVFGDVAVAHGSVTEKRAGTEKILAVSLFGWIFSRSEQANGWSCAVQAPE
jgi:hypothetical protein